MDVVFWSGGFFCLFCFGFGFENDMLCFCWWVLVKVLIELGGDEEWFEIDLMVGWWVCFMVGEFLGFLLLMMVFLKLWIIGCLVVIVVIWCVL